MRPSIVDLGARRRAATVSRANASIILNDVNFTPTAKKIAPLLGGTYLASSLSLVVRSLVVRGAGVFVVAAVISGNVATWSTGDSNT